MIKLVSLFKAVLSHKLNKWITFIARALGTNEEVEVIWNKSSVNVLLFKVKSERTTTSNYSARISQQFLEVMERKAIGSNKVLHLRS